jgi:AAA family ATP:ADP antiporter
VSAEQGELPVSLLAQLAPQLTRVPLDNVTNKRRLANEITNLSDAATLYPLFGLGANLAQALAGLVLKVMMRCVPCCACVCLHLRGSRNELRRQRLTHNATTACRNAGQTTGGAAEFGRALQLSMAAVIGIAGVSILLQQHITNEAEASAARARHRHQHRHNSSSAASSRAATPAVPGDAAAAVPLAEQQHQQQPDAAEAAAVPQRRESLVQSFKVLTASLEIRCLAIMSLAQGLCNSLMEFAWKCHMRLLYPSPADFTAFLGECVTWGKGHASVCCRTPRTVRCCRGPAAAAPASSQTTALCWWRHASVPPAASRR